MNQPIVEYISGFHLVSARKLKSRRPSATGQSGGMADALDSKSSARKGVWVQVPPLVPFIRICLLLLFGTIFDANH